MTRRRSPVKRWAADGASEISEAAKLADPENKLSRPQNQALSQGFDAAEAVADLIFQRHVEQLYAKGPRVVAELLAEIGARRSIQFIIDEMVERYAEIDDTALVFTGGARFPPPISELGK